MRWRGSARKKRDEMENLMIAYAIIAVVLTGYIASIVARTRKIARALERE